MKKLILSSITALAALSSAAALADCTQADVMKAVQHSYGSSYKYASDYYGNTDTAPTYKRTNSSDQYLFWVDKDGTSFKAVVTDHGDSAGPCKGLTAWVDVKNGQ